MTFCVYLQHPRESSRFLDSNATDHQIGNLPLGLSRQILNLLLLLLKIKHTIKMYPWYSKKKKKNLASQVNDQKDFALE